MAAAAGSSAGKVKCLDRRHCKQKQTESEMAAESSVTPRFLQRLFAQEEERQRERERAAVASMIPANSENGGEPVADLAGQERPLPPLTYSSSSATSSEPPCDLFREREREKEREREAASSTYSYGYHTDVESSGYSSQESRSTSPTSKSAFSSPAFALSCDYQCQHQHHYNQHQSSASPKHLSFAFSSNLQPLSLPPPSLELPFPPIATYTSSPAPTSPNITSDPIYTSSACLSTTHSSSTVTTASTEGDSNPLTPSIGTLDLPFYDNILLDIPENFAMVYPSVYRSSFPSKKHYPFLRSLGLKTVLTLVQDDYPEANRNFFRGEGIAFHQIGIPGNKEPFLTIPDSSIRAALAIVLDARNHPLLIHCNKGKHRTGCLVGCLRKMQCWSETAIIDEYRRFSHPKSRAMDQLFIELYKPVRKRPFYCIPDSLLINGIKGLAMRRCRTSS